MHTGGVTTTLLDTRTPSAPVRRGALGRVRAGLEVVLALGLAYLAFAWLVEHARQFEAWLAAGLLNAAGITNVSGVLAPEVLVFPVTQGPLTAEVGASGTALGAVLVLVVAAVGLRRRAHVLAALMTTVLVVLGVNTARLILTLLAGAEWGDGGLLALGNLAGIAFNLLYALVGIVLMTRMAPVRTEAEVGLAEDQDQEEPAVETARGVVSEFLLRNVVPGEMLAREAEKREAQLIEERRADYRIGHLEPVQRRITVATLVAEGLDKNASALLAATSFEGDVGVLNTLAHGVVARPWTPSAPAGVSLQSWAYEWLAQSRSEVVAPVVVEPVVVEPVVVEPVVVEPVVVEPAGGVVPVGEPITAPVTTSSTLTADIEGPVATTSDPDSEPVSVESASTKSVNIESASTEAVDIESTREMHDALAAAVAAALAEVQGERVANAVASTNDLEQAEGGASEPVESVELVVIETPETPAALVERLAHGRARRVLVTGAGGAAGGLVVRHLVEKGHHVIGVDAREDGAAASAAQEWAQMPFADQFAYHEALERVVTSTRPEILISTVGAETSNLTDMADRLEELGCVLWLPSEEVAALTGDKVALAAAFEAGGVPTAWTTSDPRALRGAGPWILKPRGTSRTRGTSGVRVVDAAGAQSLRPRSEVLQEQLMGREFQADAFCSTDGNVLACSPYWVAERAAGTDGEAADDASSAGRSTTFTSAEVEAVVGAALRAVGLIGAASVRGFVSPEGAVSVIGVRAGHSDGLDLTLAAGVDMVGLELVGTLVPDVELPELPAVSGVSVERGLEERAAR